MAAPKKESPKQEAPAKAVVSTPGATSTEKREPSTNKLGNDIERTTY